MAKYVIGPNDVLNYSESLTPWLAQGETILTASVIGDGNITVSRVAHDDTSVSWTVSNGVLGSTASAVIHFTTNTGEERDVTITYRVITR